MSTPQPKWKVLSNSDSRRLLVDKTGVYDPELEVADEYEENGKVKFAFYRFPLPRLAIVQSGGKRYLVSASIAKKVGSLPHPLPQYQEWFVKDLKAVARSHGTTFIALVKALVSANPHNRAWAYESIGGHHGFNNFDSYPQTLTEGQLNKKWR